nr:amidohydrolase family protein [Chloroflexota bacterium]
MPIVELPGLIDAHVHLRDPGGTHKEDFYTGTCAALHGGIVAVLDMPNNIPPLTDTSTLAEKKRRAAEKAVCDYGFFVGASTDNADAVGNLRDAVGLKMYLNESYGPLRLEQLPLLMKHFQSWPKGRPIAVHAEEHMVAVAIALGQLYGQHVHICHLSRRAEMELVRRAKERGWKVTCEVTPHHLFLSEEDQRALGALAYMKPTLGSAEDRQALWDNLDIIDVVATDHAPHTLEEKKSAQPPPGVPGLETMLPLMLTAVAEGRLSLDRLVSLTSTGPARVYGLQPQQDSRVVVDTDACYEIDASHLFTKCSWTPFQGWQVKGRVLRTYVRGTLAYEEGRILVAPGYGIQIGLY